MTHYLSRIKLYLIGTLLILFIMLGVRFVYITTGTITSGKVMRIFESKSRSLRGSGSMAIPLVGFYNNAGYYVFSGTANVPLHVGDHVPVVYQPSDPDGAMVYNFDGVWLGPLIYSIFPLLILTAVLFSFVQRDDLLTVCFKPFSIKKIKLAEPDSQ